MDFLQFLFVWFVVFLNSPYRGTPKNVLKKKAKKKISGVPRKLIKYTPRSVGFFYRPLVGPAPPPSPSSYSIGLNRPVCAPRAAL
jgi:hypothetical protein